MNHRFSLVVGSLLCFAPRNDIAVAQTNAPAATAQHSSAVELVELSGARKRLVENSDKIFQTGVEAVKRDPRVTPEFADEWGKRMRANYKPDDYLQVMVKVWEAHFNAEELAELVQAQKAMNASKQPALPDALKAKLGAENNAIQSEILGGCAQVGAKIGADIAQGIQKDHPEWVKPVPQSPAK